MALITLWCSNRLLLICFVALQSFSYPYFLILLPICWWSSSYVNMSYHYRRLFLFSTARENTTPPDKPRTFCVIVCCSADIALRPTIRSWSCDFLFSSQSSRMDEQRCPLPPPLKVSLKSAFGLVHKPQSGESSIIENVETLAYQPPDSHRGSHLLGWEFDRNYMAAKILFCLLHANAFTI